MILMQLLRGVLHFEPSALTTSGWAQAGSTLDSKSEQLPSPV